MAVQERYRRWLAGHAEPTAIAVGVVEFSHPAWAKTQPRSGSVWVCDYEEAFAATDETGYAFTAQPVSMEIAVPDVGPATEQRVTLRMDALAGAVIPKIRALNATQRQDPVKVTLRWYLDNDTARPARDPFDLIVVEVRAVRMVVEFDLSTSPLPNLQAGIRYDLENFPALGFL